MHCPRCGGHVTVFELGEAVSQVCEDCSYVGVVVDHRPENIDIESWDDALTRFQTEFPDSVPDGVARVDDDTAPPDGPPDDDETGDSGFQFRGSPESTTIAESGPEPGTDFPTGETRSNVLGSSEATVVAASDSAADPVDSNAVLQSDEASAAANSTAGTTEGDSPGSDAVADDSAEDPGGVEATWDTTGGDSGGADEDAQGSDTTGADKSSGNRVTVDREDGESKGAADGSEDQPSASGRTGDDGVATDPDKEG
jgi:hypothetical protein